MSYIDSIAIYVILSHFILWTKPDYFTDLHVRNTPDEQNKDSVAATDETSYLGDGGNCA